MKFFRDSQSPRPKMFRSLNAEVDRACLQKHAFMGPVGAYHLNFQIYLRFSN